MKRAFLVFFMFSFAVFSQEKQVNLDFLYGISSPSSEFSDNSYAANGNYIEISPSFYFSKIGIGGSIGQLSNPTSDNINSLTSELQFSTLNSTQDWKSVFYGIGPEVFFDLADKIRANVKTRIGSMSIKEMSLSSSFDAGDGRTFYPVYNFESTKQQTGFFSSSLQLSYSVSNSVRVFVNANYFSALSDNIKTANRRRIIQDLNKNGIVDAEDFLADVTEDSFVTENISIKPEFTNVGFGITYQISTGKKRINPTHKENTNEKVNPLYTPKNVPKQIVFENKSKKTEKVRAIVLLKPISNKTFKSTDEIKEFSWEVVGKNIPSPKFIIEIQKINGAQQPERSFAKETSKTKISTKQLLGDFKLSEGKYRWYVKEVSTGTSSNPSFFNMSNCEIDFTISNEEIECLGYEGEDRKFKICFDSTYSSSSGDLTYANAGSGLTVFDQTYSPLSYTLVSPNPTLITQVGAATTTVSYCFEVVVSSSVTQIGFGLQGDDLDPSPLLCQPGVSTYFDELPECVCDDCEEIELSMENISISQNGSFGNQFNINGNLSVNVPIYGVEFQVQSYSYSATPSPCSDGVSSVEESGMFLMPGTTINGSSSLQLANETVSGSTSTNNNATKNIKYSSNSPITGSIPINLTVGLPGPLSGFDASCCTMEYTVCIKVKVFYEEGNCKSCVFTHCFEFNNQ